MIDERPGHRGQHWLGNGHGSRDEQQALLHMEVSGGKGFGIDATTQTIAHRGAAWRPPHCRISVPPPRLHVRLGSKLGRAGNVRCTTALPPKAEVRPRSCYV